MQIPLTSRQINLSGVLITIGMMAFALYSQHVVGLDPCPLCIFQRIAVMALGVVFLAAFLHNARGWGRYVYAFLFIDAGACGAIVAGRHVYLQSLPADQVPACGPGLEYMLDAFPLADALKKVFAGSGECAEVVWRFLGLSMPAWVFICVVGLGIGGALNSLRKPS